MKNANRRHKRARASASVFVAALMIAACSESTTEVAMESVAVFENGSGDYACYRIPALAVSNDGTLLAFAEGRRTCHDHSHNDLLLKRSTDNGQSWSDAQVLIANDNVMVNPSPVVLENGDVLILIEEFPTGHHARAGEFYDLLEEGFGDGSDRVWSLRSTDDGLTWSEPNELTKISRGESGGVLTAGSPAAAIQLQHGEHKGRILAPQYYTTWSGDDRRNFLGVLYSDDDGESWQRGGYVSGLVDKSSEFLTDCNEVHIAEMAEGTVVLNARGNVDGRYASFSIDGGISWQRTQRVLDVTANNDAMIAFSDANQDTVLIQTINADLSSRKHGVVLTSKDGIEWTKTVDLTMPADGFAYSALAQMSSSEIGLLYEAAGLFDSTIRFMKLDSSVVIR